MKAMSLKIREDILEEMEKTVKELKMSRNAYINKAVDLFNKTLRKERLRRQLRHESKLVSANSMEILKEMELLDSHLIE